VSKTRAARAFPVVAIGASAGGLKAFEELLGALPANPGMAFVLVPHLAPHFKSHLAEILGRCTALPVSEIKTKDKVSPNRIYVLPPGRSLLMKSGVLHLAPPLTGADRRVPIDKFLESVAADQGPRTIGVLLSGAGTDGTLGLQAIKARGGTTFGQDGETADHLSMPHSAIAAGCVDYVLAPAEIGARLGVGRVDGQKQSRKPEAEKTLDKILEVLRAAKGVEFGLYKRNTLRRRIQRRMALKRVHEPERFLALLKSDPAEVDQLFQEILIGVTSFFREPASFRALKSEIYPRILKNRPANAPIRLWVPGCSTGQEAYSHAMNMVEALGPHATFQIFATDLNPVNIDWARSGLYTRKMLSGVSPERLRRFFDKTGDGYRVAAVIRERCVFAVHNVAKDPPFTSMDLISCRNLMIYFGPALQEKVLQIFQYALKPQGVLMLGNTETVGDYSGRFTALGEKEKVFFTRTESAIARLDFSKPGRTRATEAAFKDPERVSAGAVRAVDEAFDLQGKLDGVMPARYVPNGVVVNAELEILRFLGNTTPYLRPAPGVPSMNLRKMISGELLLELRAAIQASKESGCAVTKEVALPPAGAVPRRGRVEIQPIKAGRLQKDYFLVLFEELAGTVEHRTGARRLKGERRVIKLRQTSQASGAHLKSIIDEQESTNMQLKSSNEALLSSNEELQSINEEFETTKEELQATNEELQATNEELTTSTEEVLRGNQILTRSNNDLSNLLANINIPVVLLDQDLKVHRFTPSAEKILDLSADKLGKSIVELKLPLKLSNLKDLLLTVIKTGHVKTLEVQAAAGRWYYLILRPYRTDKSKTEKSRTEGAVLALIDIHDRKLSEKTVLRLATLVLDSNDAVIICDLNDRVIAWNKGAQKMYGYAESEALGMSIRRLRMPESKLIRARELVRIAAQQGKKAIPIETQRRTKDGRTLDVMLTVTVLRDDDGQPVEVATTERDITDKNRTDRERKLSEKSVLRLATAVLDSNDAVIICDLKDRIIAWNSGARKMYGYTEAEALGMSIRRLRAGNLLIGASELVRVSAAPIEIQRRTKDGRILDVQLTVTVLRDDNRQPVEVATTERDITEFRRAERERKISDKNAVRLANAVRDSNDAVIICDLEDRIIAWNKGAHKMYGYSEADALGMSACRLMPKHARFTARELVRTSPPPMEIQRRTKDGRLIDVMRTVTVLRDANGQPMEIVKTERDITERKRSESERKISEKSVVRLASLVHDSNDGVIICDLKDKIIAWNKGAQKMYGYTEAEAIGMNIKKLMPENKLIRARELVRIAAQQGKKAAPIETQRMTKYGRIVDVLLTVTVLNDENGQPVEVATTERDITLIKGAEREFRRLHARVISAQETERNRLARDLHDGVGQILSGVKFRLQALPGQMKLGGAAETKLMKVGSFLDHAIAEIRRVSQNLMPAELVDLGLEPALLTLCREFKERSGIHVTVRTAPAPVSPEMGLAFFRIAQEALTNIGRHSKATMVAVSLSRKGKDIVLSVSDNGIGFNPGLRPATKGRGIGLGNMRQRAESVGGSIDVHSTPGAGTSLNVHAPLMAVIGVAS
jgi:two-component system CheB/CheR fusion protein